MPPGLALSRAMHSKMIVSPPRINLRRAASYTQDRGPLSSTSSRFGFDHLLFSPPPSPSLPALLPRRRRTPSRPRPSRVARLFVWLSGTVLLLYVASTIVRRSQLGPVLAWSSRSRERYEMIGQDSLPDFPTPIVVSDKRGRAKWTVYVPPNLEFPLSVTQYSDMSAKCQEVSGRVNTLRSNNHAFHQIGLVSATAGDDQHFLDAAEARNSGLLPGAGTKKSATGNLAVQSTQPRYFVGADKAGLENRPVCEKSATFVLESLDAGMGKALMLLWMAYGWAKSENRAFFIDDTRWAYGQYLEIFQPPPVPSCRPPPKDEILPCPRQARHLVLTPATAAGLLGFQPDAEVDADQRQRELFDLAKQGCTALFRPSDADVGYVEDRIRELKAKSLVPKSRGLQDGLIVGAHVRHGDRHPVEFQYRDSYMPLNFYTERAKEIIEDRFNATAPRGTEDKTAKEHSQLILASDDPLVYDHEEFRGASHAQERIKLASKAAIQEVNPDRQVMHKFVDETFGWDGGFFGPMFWNLGRQSDPKAAAAAAAAATDDQSDGRHSSPESARLRNLVGRAYVMDLAVLADASDFVVCTVSAMGCRLLAVMMGWEHAFVKGRWVNIDGDYGWTAL